MPKRLLLTAVIGFGIWSLFWGILIILMQFGYGLKIAKIATNDGALVLGITILSLFFSVFAFRKTKPRLQHGIKR